jgi:hypothetical protein
MGVNEGNCISCYLSNIMKGEPCCFLLIHFLPFVNTHASYRIGVCSLDQGKHLAYTLYRFLLYNIYLMSMFLHLSIGV